MSTDESRNKYLRECAQILELLPLLKLAALLNKDEFVGEIMDAAELSPTLMERVVKVVKLTPPGLTAEEQAECRHEGEQLAKKLLAGLH